jgi:uncharacterized protein YlxW (UPF0749 family)
MSLDLDDLCDARRGPTMRPPSRARTRIALVVVALAVGVLVGLQVNARQEATTRLAAESAEDLTAILADLNAEADTLGRQLADLRVRLSEYESSAEREDLAIRDARKRLADLQVLAGTTAVHGPGIELEIADPRVRLIWEQMLDLVQELRDAGAEAIAVNGRRVVAGTWFGPGEPGVVVDGDATLPPYSIEAIGSAEAMREALGIPGGPISVIQAQPGVAITIEEATRLRLPAADPAAG